MYFQKDDNDPESNHSEREPEQERCDDNEIEIHRQEFKSDSFEREEGVRGNNKIELITGISVDNEEADRTVAVPVPPIVIHNLESHIDPDINTDTENISSSTCLYLILLFRPSIQIT